MSATVPDLGALYLIHRDAMHQVAASVLREAGLASQAGDAVHDAMVSIMSSPPNNIRNWEAFLVTAAKRKALDRIRSADARHTGSGLPEEALNREDDGVDIAEEVSDDVDKKNRAAIAWDCLAVLEDRGRRVVWDICALERPPTCSTRPPRLQTTRTHRVVG
jgi:RNA polymerase sigma-70 factor (ECF subfamily)